MKVLFICSANKLRSPTAHTLFEDWPDIEASSAGLDTSATTPVTHEMVAEADLIIVMEKHHRDKIRKKFKDRPNDNNILTLNIPDIYERDDPELIELLLNKVPAQLNTRLGVSIDNIFKKTPPVS